MKGIEHPISKQKSLINFDKTFKMVGVQRLLGGKPLVPHKFGTVLTDVHFREQTLILSAGTDKMSSASDTSQKNRPNGRIFLWWACRDSNSGPAD